MDEKTLEFMLNPFDIISLITKYRKEKGLTLNELSNITNISKSTLSRIESRETEKIDYNLVIKLKSVLEIPDDEILMSMNYMREEETKQNMELVDSSKGVISGQCNVCGRTTSESQNTRLNEDNIKELRLGYRNQCQCINLCKTCRENLRDLLDKDLREK